VARARVGSGICGESRRAAERARRACWAGNHGWVGAGGRARAWDVREVGIERDREVGDQEGSGGRRGSLSGARGICARAGSAAGGRGERGQSTHGS
jgi:hypothetical protein